MKAKMSGYLFVKNNMYLLIIFLKVLYNYYNYNAVIWMAHIWNTINCYCRFKEFSVNKRFPLNKFNTFKIKLNLKITKISFLASWFHTNRSYIHKSVKFTPTKPTKILVRLITFSLTNKLWDLWHMISKYHKRRIRVKNMLTTSLLMAILTLRGLMWIKFVNIFYVKETIEKVTFSTVLFFFHKLVTDIPKI